MGSVHQNTVELMGSVHQNTVELMGSVQQNTVELLPSCVDTGGSRAWNEGEVGGRRRVRAGRRGWVDGCSRRASCFAVTTRKASFGRAIVRRPVL